MHIFFIIFTGYRFWSQDGEARIWNPSWFRHLSAKYVIVNSATIVSLSTRASDICGNTHNFWSYFGCNAVVAGRNNLWNSYSKNSLHLVMILVKNFPWLRLLWHQSFVKKTEWHCRSLDSRSLCCSLVWCHLYPSGSRKFSFAIYDAFCPIFSVCKWLRIPKLSRVESSLILGWLTVLCHDAGGQSSRWLLRHIVDKQVVDCISTDFK